MSSTHHWRQMVAANPSRQHQPPEAAAREDTLQHLKRATSALVAWSLLSGRDVHVLGRNHATLQDVLDDLERVR